MPSRPIEYGPEDLMSDDSDDPDYRESSADEDEDELPPSMARDRAQWTVENQDVIGELYRMFKDSGSIVFGGAFFQTGSITAFAHFIYRYTSPGAD